MKNGNILEEINKKLDIILQEQDAMKEQISNLEEVFENNIKSYKKENQKKETVNSISSLSDFENFINRQDSNHSFFYDISSRHQKSFAKWRTSFITRNKEDIDKLFKTNRKENSHIKMILVHLIQETKEVYPFITEKHLRYNNLLDYSESVTEAIMDYELINDNKISYELFDNIINDKYVNKKIRKLFIKILNENKKALNSSIRFKDFRTDLSRAAFYNPEINLQFGKLFPIKRKDVSGDGVFFMTALLPILILVAPLIMYNDTKIKQQKYKNKNISFISIMKDIYRYYLISLYPISSEPKRFQPNKKGYYLD